MPLKGRQFFSLASCLLIAAVCWPSAAEGKKFMRCEFARKLVENYNFDRTLLSSWICLVEHESSFETNVVRQKTPLTSGYGIFQIGNNVACGVDRRGGKCNKKCSDFLDDNIDDDVACAKLIADVEGFKYWRGWQVSCKDRAKLPNLKTLCNSDTFGQRRRRTPPLRRRRDLARRRHSALKASGRGVRFSEIVI